MDRLLEKVLEVRKAYECRWKNAAKAKTLIGRVEPVGEAIGIRGMVHPEVGEKDLLAVGRRDNAEPGQEYDAVELSAELEMQFHVRAHHKAAVFMLVNFDVEASLPRKLRHHSGELPPAGGLGPSR
jgi:hypothetical protein